MVSTFVIFKKHENEKKYYIWMEHLIEIVKEFL